MTRMPQRASRSPAAPMPAPAMGRINWAGLWVLCGRETLRFLKISQQTIAGPMVTTLLFLAVFALALGGTFREVGGRPFLEFLAPGLIVMSVMQNAFANSSSSLLSAKMTGNIVDLLMPPLAPGELLTGFLVGGLARGLCVGLAVSMAMWAFVPIRLHDAAVLGYYVVSAALLMSLLGVLTGVWAEKFDHMSTITNFVVTPLSFLSGTFYSIERLPEPFYTVIQFNPFFYVIDGFRYSFIGHSDANLGLGMTVLAVINVALLIWALWMFRTGYRLKH
jgi:ABC-2 type transport system permease protein